MKVKDDLLIFPCNGNALEALDCLGDRFRLIGFVDDTAEKQAAGLREHSVWPRSCLHEHGDAFVLAVPGSPTSFRRRGEVVEGLELPAARFAQVIHPAARLATLSKVGYNVLVMAGVVSTSNASIGNHVCILPNTVIHHDAIIGDWTLIGANVAIAGGVEIGRNCYIGSGSSLRNGVRVGDGALIGLGSVVVKDVPAGATVAGNPARQLRA